MEAIPPWLEVSSSRERTCSGPGDFFERLLLSADWANALELEKKSDMALLHGHSQPVRICIPVQPGRRLRLVLSKVSLLVAMLVICMYLFQTLIAIDESMVTLVPLASAFWRFLILGRRLVRLLLAASGSGPSASYQVMSQ